MRFTVTSIRARLNSRFPFPEEGLAELLGCLPSSCCDSLAFVLFSDSATVEVDAKGGDVCDCCVALGASSDVEVDAAPSLMDSELTSSSCCSDCLLRFGSTCTYEVCILWGRSNNKSFKQCEHYS